MAYGVTEAGFSLKRFTDILNDVVLELQQVIDPVTGEQLTPYLENENDPLVQIINAEVDQLAAAWEQLQYCYNQHDPSKATGAGLEGIVQLNGIRRRAGTPSTVVLTLSGTAGTVIPQASALITNTAGTVIVRLTEDATIEGGGTVDVLAESTVIGPVSIPATSLVKILTPITGWTGVTNASQEAVLGTLVETDPALQGRQKLSTMTPANNQVEAIYGAIANLEGVELCRVYQNITLIEDGRGIPAKSLAVVVKGGEDNDIAQVLWLKASAFPLFGSTTVTLYDRWGFEQVMSFIRPTEVPITVVIDVTVVNANVWPGATGAALIKDAILLYATQGAGALGATSGWDRDGYLVGDSVYSSELYVPINSVPGIQITGVTVEKSGGTAGDSVAIEWDELATFAAEDITVNVTVP